MRAMAKLSLTSNFSPATEADWRTIVAKALKDAPFETLKTPLYEGFRTEPLYTGHGSTPALSGNRGWAIMQPLSDEKQLADDLANGTSALSVAFDTCPGLETKSDAEALIGNVDASFFIAPGSGVADAALLVASKDAR